MCVCVWCVCVCVWVCVCVCVCVCVSESMCICVCDSDDCRRSAPALGDEGSHRLDVSLQVMDVCSESLLGAAVGFVGILLVLDEDLPIRSTGLGRGTPASNCKTKTQNTST